MSSMSNITTADGHKTRNGRDARLVPNRPGGITQPQYDFLVDLFHEKDLLKDRKFAEAVRVSPLVYDEFVLDIIEKVRHTRKQDASKLIEALRALPRKTRSEAKGQDLDHYWHPVAQGKGDDEVLY